MALGSGIRDLGSAKNLFRIQGSKRHLSRIRIRNTGITNAAEQRMGMDKHREYLMYYREPGFLAAL
jgi:hypothetical protein